MNKTKVFTVTFSVLLLLAFNPFFTIVEEVKADDSDIVLTIENMNISEYDTFVLHINCAPGQPVKGWEFSIIFNNSLLQADEVAEGDLFSGYSTFFNAGTINNSSGNITNIYGFIIGTGNVTDPGSCVNITFTAIGVGEAEIKFLYEGVIDPGVTNETQYLPLVVNNGTIDISISTGGSSGFSGANHTMLLILITVISVFLIVGVATSGGKK